jgi:Na+/H+-dicarboxylate symporter
MVQFLVTYKFQSNFINLKVLVIFYIFTCLLVVLVFISIVVGKNKIASKKCKSVGFICDLLNGFAGLNKNT